MSSYSHSEGNIGIHAAVNDVLRAPSTYLLEYELQPSQDVGCK